MVAGRIIVAGTSKKLKISRQYVNEARQTTRQKTSYIVPSRHSDTNRTIRSWPCKFSTSVDLVNAWVHLGIILKRFVSSAGIDAGRSIMYSRKLGEEWGHILGPMKRAPAVLPGRS